VTNSSSFAGDFPLLALKIPHPQTPLVPGKPKWWLSLKKGFIVTHLLSQEFDSVHCTFCQKLEVLKVAFLILAPILQVVFDDISLDWITRLHEGSLKTFSE